MSGRPRTSALDAWLGELRRGERTRTTIDPLWSAACAEQWAVDLAQFPQIAQGFRRDAVKILHDAAAQQERGEPLR